MALSDAAAAGRALGRLAVNALLPPTCLRCGAAVSVPGTLCGACWEQVSFIAPPMCACCGYPFELAPAEGQLCAACQARPPAFDRARAVMAYDGGSRDLVLGFKHADRTEGAPAYATWMLRAAADVLPDAEVAVPVPLHRWRLLRRRYNQAALLANALGRRAGVPVCPDALLRTRNNPSQGAMTTRGRWRNVQGVFAAHPRRRAAVAGRRVLLVDDVMTTGATLEACARVLRRAGATGVDAVTLARVVRPR